MKDEEILFGPQVQVSNERIPPIPESDVVMLESLIQSPVYAAFKRLVDAYRRGSYNMLLNAHDTQKLFQAQGHVIGLNLIESLPGIVVRERQSKIKEEEHKRKLEEEIKKRTYRERPPIPKLKKPAK